MQTEIKSYHKTFIYILSFILFELDICSKPIIFIWILVIWARLSYKCYITTLRKRICIISFNCDKNRRKLYIFFLLFSTITPTNSLPAHRRD